MDTVGKPPIAGTNLYEYAGGNPITRIDPFGLDWIYFQSTGELWHLSNTGTDAAAYVATGYAGQGAGLNNPSMQNEIDFGPPPQGGWDIGPQQTNVTARGVALEGSMRLSPQRGTVTYGRGGFLFHRGNLVTRNSSKGCIALPKDVLDRVGNSGDTTLWVAP